ncbi:hypothetical protein ALC57_14073 [Trachymyrmex cornetzi]|uniref:Uncharacterized protein n=1 Tax=Trachymyrmex cornetzi TaxID=471704 RepID=A0A151IYV3_9HYME|nr:hypothetical protein ALC57_14073 [Trachymyrmex cornetzi]
MTLAGVTGHEIRVIGKITATILLDGRRIEHPIYVIADDFPIDYEGILGVDFLQKHHAKCDYSNKLIEIGDSTLKLYPYKIIRINPRCEAIIEVTSTTNNTGVVQAEETQPGVLIGNCLVQPKNHLCLINVINTTEKHVEMQVPCVTPINIDSESNYEAPIQAVEKDNEFVISRNTCINNTLNLKHLNNEEKQSIIGICTQYNDIFHLKGDQLTYINTARRLT